MALCKLDHSPKHNWVEDSGGLPRYIHEVACSLVEGGMTVSHAIATAVSRMKVWAVTGEPKTKAKAAAALAEWEAKKAKAHAKRETPDMTYEIREAAGGGVTPEGDPDKGLFAARVLNYGPVDDHGTSWAPGCFRESLERKLPKAVWSHDKHRIIGKVVDYRDSHEGLDVIVQLANGEAVPDAKMTRSLLQDDMVDEFSFAFSREADEDDPSHRGATRITKATMFEVSPVLVASGQGTRTIGVRSATRAEATDLLQRVANGEMTTAEALEALSAETRAADEDMVTIPAIEYRSLMEKAGIKAPSESDPNCCVDTDTEFRAIDDLLSEDW